MGDGRFKIFAIGASGEINCQYAGGAKIKLLPSSI
jgi:hypothetical protein